MVLLIPRGVAKLQETSRLQTGNAVSLIHCGRAVELIVGWCRPTQRCNGVGASRPPE